MRRGSFAVSRAGHSAGAPEQQRRADVAEVLERRRELNDEIEHLRRLAGRLEDANGRGHDGRRRIEELHDDETDEPDLHADVALGLVEKCAELLGGEEADVAVAGEQRFGEEHAGVAVAGKSAQRQTRRAHTRCNQALRSRA